MKVKQYVTKDAYTGNTEISIYEDGKLVSSTIENDYNVDGYTNALKNMGYERAYDVDEWENKFREIEEEYKWIKEMYEKAKSNPVYKK